MTTIKVSSHFTLYEATRSSTATRRSIRNVPSAAEIKQIEQVAIHILEPPRVHYKRSITPSSWFRCLVLNRAVGSEDSSQHPLAQAVDFEISGIDNLELAHWMEHNVDFDQLIMEFYDSNDPAGGWIHGSYVSKDSNRHEIITYSNGVYSHGLPRLIS